MSAAGEEKADVLIAGGGPAGMVAGLLFARAGLRTILLEKHDDFLRDFRGDTVHPSTLRIFHELGLLGALLQRPHDRLTRIGGQIGDREYGIADFSRMDPRWGFTAMMPQWEFLDFVAGEARKYPNFRLLMGTEAVDLLVGEEGRITGFACRSSHEERHLHGRLMIGADGRGSRLRAAAGLVPVSLGAPIDVFWFRMPKARAPENQTKGIFIPGRILVLIDRGDYWQCAYVFPKGEAARVRERGLASFRAEVEKAAASVAPDVAAIESWDDVKLLAVAIDRLEQWHRPGLLLIGDAAHAMSPIGGIGINLAIQDAVAAANLLAAPLQAGKNVDDLLPAVEKRRGWPVRVVQAFQKATQDRIIAPLLGADPEAELRPPLALRLLDRLALLRALPAAFLGLGLRPEHVRSPQGAWPGGERG